MIPPKKVPSIHDIKETSKRTYQFGVVAMFFAFITIFSNIIYNNWLSAWLTAAMFASMGIILILNKRGWYKTTKISTVFTVSFFIAILAFAEGLDAGGYLYFLPVVFAMPFLVDNSSKYHLELLLYFTVPISAFAIVLFFCEEKSQWQYIPKETLQRMYYTNSFCIMSLCAVFAYLSIYLERKYAKALLEQINKSEEAVEAKSKFLSNMGHELRTPLNGIIGATNFIRTETVNQEQSKYVEILKYCSDHMLGLVNDILDYNKIEQDKLELHPTKCNLKQILEQSLLPFHDRFEEKKIDLKVELDERVDLIIQADDLRLVQVLNNIVSNALKFTEKGYVKVKAAVQEEIEGKIKVQFAVEDTGIGIKKDNQGKIFNSFWQVFNESTRKYGGTGLGLTISQRLLQLMESELHVESEEGKGTTFSFSVDFPIIEKKKVTKQPVLAETQNLAGYRILFAEDNIINIMIVRKILEDWQAAVTICENGKVAVDTLKNDPDFHLVLMDLEMPEMDGHTALQEIKKMHPELPVLAFTAALMDNIMFDSLVEAGFADCVLKPFQSNNLLAKIRKYSLRETLENVA